MGDTAASNVSTQIHTIDGKDLCRVHVKPFGFTVDAEVDGSRERPALVGVTLCCSSAAVGIAPGVEQPGSGQTAAYLHQRILRAAAREGQRRGTGRTGGSVAVSPVGPASARSRDVKSSSTSGASKMR
jgi:hypothetical protein